MHFDISINYTCSILTLIINEVYLSTQVTANIAIICYPIFVNLPIILSASVVH